MTAITEQALSRRLNQQLGRQNGEAFLTLCAEFFDDYLAAIVNLQTYVWLDTAEGVWQDRIGEIVGCTRPMEEEMERVFRVRDTTDPDYDELHGFGELIGGVDSGIGGLIWSSVTGIPTTAVASTETFYYYILAKIAATNADASIPGIARFIKNAFDVDCTITVPQVGHINIELLDVTDLRQRRFIGLFLPVIAGVSCHITNWPDWGV